jgi:hypothetical protein
MNINELKKDLYRTKALANFSHYCEGKLYYTVGILGVVHQFPIATTERDIKYVSYNNATNGESSIEVETLKLSSDLGTTPFSAQIKGSDLIRWLTKALDNGELVRLTPDFGGSASINAVGKTELRDGDGNLYASQG